MKRVIVALIVGILLGSSTLAYAQSKFWARDGLTYHCVGGPKSVFCNETNWKPGYTVAIYPGAVSVMFGKKMYFWCNRKYQPNGNCTYYGR